MLERARDVDRRVHELLRDPFERDTPEPGEGDHTLRHARVEWELDQRRRQFVRE